MALSTVQRLFAPFLPFVTEEVWNWWQDGSIHVADWPEADGLRAAAAGVGPGPSDVASEALSVVRREKSEAKRKLRTAVVSATFATTQERLEVLDQVIDDVKAAGVIQSVTTGTVTDRPEIEVSAELEPEAEAS